MPPLDLEKINSSGQMNLCHSLYLRTNLHRWQPAPQQQEGAIRGDHILTQHQVFLRHYKTLGKSHLGQTGRKGPFYPFSIYKEAPLRRLGRIQVFSSLHVPTLTAAPRKLLFPQDKDVLSCPSISQACAEPPLRPSSIRVLLCSLY